MLTYILPLVLLLLIAIIVVMKKRSNTQKPLKGKAKESSSSTVKAEENQAIENQQKEDEAIQKENEKQFQTIQSLVAQEQFYDAEALINQSLNRDHKQAHLYSLLLEIYQKQDNQLAINQILNDLRTLQMFDTLREIENKIAAKKAAEEKEAQQKAVQAAKEKQQAEKEQAERERAQKAAQPVATPVTEKTVPAESKPDTEKPVQEKLTSENQPVQENTANFEPLEFPSSSNKTTSLESQASSEKETSSTQQHDQEHVLEFEFDTPKAETKPQSQPEPILAEPKKDEQDAHFIDFDFSSQSQSEKKDAESEQPVKAETTSHGQSFELHFDQPAEVAPKASVTPPAETKKADESPAITPAETDHLFLSFPELSEVSENALNIKLAKQYIDMGEFARASDLLTDPYQSFTAEEQTEVDQLLNKIAS